jgi:hypothetical protein
MYPLDRVIPSVLIALCLVACDKPLGGGSDRVDAPRFDFTNNPGTHSPIIVRVAGVEVRVITVDAVRQLLAIHGPVDNLPVCTNASTRDSVDGQQVNTPSQVGQSILLLRAADTHVAIYGGTDISALFPFNPAEFCPFIENTPKLYEGTVQYTVNLNNASADFRWEGDVVRDADGAPFHYVELEHSVFQAGSQAGNAPSSGIRVVPLGN